MIRVMAENLLLFLLPTVLYLAFRYVQRVRARSPDAGSAGKAIRSDLNDAPFLILFITGAALVLATLIAFGSTDSGKPGQTYYPPTIKDGKVIPGHFK